MTRVSGTLYRAATVFACGLMVGFLASPARVHARPAAAQVPTPRSIWSGIYTEAQAKRGQTLYMNECANCHASNLSGNESAPALLGDDFAADWIGGSVGELFERTKVTMPQDSPGRLTSQQCADVVAFVLSVNKYPSGTADLPSDAAALKQIHWDKDRPNLR